MFQVDLFSARGKVPGDLFEVEDVGNTLPIQAARASTPTISAKHMLRCAIVELFEWLPPEARQSADIRKLRDLGDDHAVAIVHLIYRGASDQGQAIDYEFSRTSMDEHWQAGLDDGVLDLRRPRWRPRRGSAACRSTT